MFDLNKAAVSCLKGEDAVQVLQKYLETKGVEMVHAVHPTVAAAQPPQGTGAVDPLRR